MNLGLTREDYDKLVKDLQEGNEKLFEIAFKKLVRNGITKLKEQRKGDDSFIEDVVIETLLFLRKRIIKGKVKYGAVEFLFQKILFQQYTNFKRGSLNSISLDDSLGVNDITEEKSVEYDEEQFKILRTAFDKLDGKCFELLEMVYFKKKSFSELAKIHGANEYVLRKRKQRCLEKLKTVLKNNQDFF